VADGVGANAIFAAMTDWTADEDEHRPAPDLPDDKGPWGHPPGLGHRVADAVVDRVALDLARARQAAHTLLDTALHPSQIARGLAVMRSFLDVLRFDSHSPLKRYDTFGRARRLVVLDLPFEDVRGIRHALGGSMIDVILTIMARAIGRWHAEHGLDAVEELMTLVPVNLRRPEEWTEQTATGNVATGLLVPLPIRLTRARDTFDEVHRRVERAKADPAAGATPMLADLLSTLGRRFVTWMGEVTFGAVDFIVTNVPGILATRYLAGAEILAAYPFAPVALRSPASVALYGYRDRLFIGIDADETAMPDVEIFEAAIVEAFLDLTAATGHP
jgi:diacylglycerol O-acyltransferase